jgi:protein-L-isoaspartate O-methyltransferase
VDDRELTPPYARFLVHLIRPFPNFDVFFVKSLRRKAVQHLQLKPGDRVLDAGCGPGGSFPYLVDVVGPSGEVVGVEISPQMAINARRRIAARGWSNVRVIEGNVETIELEGKFKGMVMLGAPDVYASPRALDNLLPHLVEDGRVVIFGAKLLRSSKKLSSLFRSAFSHLTFSSTPALDFEPLAQLEARIGKLQVREYVFGWMFMAWGSVKQAEKS